MITLYIYIYTHTHVIHTLSPCHHFIVNIFSLSVVKVVFWFRVRNETHIYLFGTFPLKVYY